MKKSLIFLWVAIFLGFTFQVSFAQEVNILFFDKTASAWKIVNPADSSSGTIILKKDNGEVVVKDGKEVSGFTVEGTRDGLGGCNTTPMYIIKYSPDGKSLVFIGHKIRKWTPDYNVYVVKDGIPSSGYDEVAYDSLFFSSDGKDFIFFARKWDKWFFVKNGTESSNHYSAILSPVYLPGNNALSFISYQDGRVYRNSEYGREIFFEIDWKYRQNISKYNVIYTVHSRIFSPNGKRSAFILHEDVIDRRSGLYISIKDYLVKDWRVVEIKEKEGVLQYLTKDDDFIINPVNLENSCGWWQKIQLPILQNEKDTTNKASDKTIKTNDALRAPASGFSVITEKQKKSLLKQFEKLTSEQIYAYAEKTDRLLQNKKLSSTRRKTLEDVKRLLYIVEPSDGVGSQQQFDEIFFAGDDTGKVKIEPLRK